MDEHSVPKHDKSDKALCSSCNWLMSFIATYCYCLASKIDTVYHSKQVLVDFLEQCVALSKADHVSLQTASYWMFTKVETIMTISHARSLGQGHYGLIVLKHQSQRADPHTLDVIIQKALLRSLMVKSIPKLSQEHQQFLDHA
jgi:hypothetical protein